MQRADFTRGNARHAVNGHRKIIPGAYSLVAEMINTGDDALIDSRKDGTCQIVGISRRTALVENNSQPLAFITQTNHGLYKIIAVNGI